MKLKELIPDCLSEENLNMDLEIFSDIISDDSYHYAELIKKYHELLVKLLESSDK